MGRNLCLIAWICLATSTAARATDHAAIDSARAGGCRAALAPLRESAALGRAASLLAGGLPLHTALSVAGYRAAQASAVHLSGVASEAELRAVLGARYCATLKDAAFVDVGVQRRGREVWLVLAAPVWLPATGSSPAIGRQILDLVNEARAFGHRCGRKTYPAAPPVTLNPTLTSAALAHSREMASYEEFDHRGHDGSTPATRIAQAGYGGFVVVGENIAAGPMTPGELVSGWLASAPHCENIMDPRFSEMGMGFAVNAASAELVYWSQEFAAPRRPRAGTNRMSVR